MVFSLSETRAIVTIALRYFAFVRKNYMLPSIGYEHVAGVIESFNFNFTLFALKFDITINLKKKKTHIYVTN